MRNDRYHPRRCSAQDIRSIFLAAVQEAGTRLDDAETWFRPRKLHRCASEEERKPGEASKEVSSWQTPRTNTTT